jgi:hypothetical protein
MGNFDRCWMPMCSLWMEKWFIASFGVQSFKQFLFFRALDARGVWITKANLWHIVHVSWYPVLFINSTIRMDLLSGFYVIFPYNMWKYVELVPHARLVYTYTHTNMCVCEWVHTKYVLGHFSCLFCLVCSCVFVFLSANCAGCHQRPDAIV